MAKYYIETNKGAMLRKPDSPIGGAWTFDPTEAWEFDKTIDEIHEPRIAFLVKWFLEETCSYERWSISVNSHAFEPMTNNPGEKVELYVDMLNHDIYSIDGGRMVSAMREATDFKGQFDDMLIKGETMVKIK